MKKNISQTYYFKNKEEIIVIQNKFNKKYFSENRKIFMLNYFQENKEKLIQTQINLSKNTQR
jgi:hypothetical protein